MAIGFLDCEGSGIEDGPLVPAIEEASQQLVEYLEGVGCGLGACCAVGNLARRVDTAVGDLYCRMLCSAR